MKLFYEDIDVNSSKPSSCNSCWSYSVDTVPYGLVECYVMATMFGCKLTELTVLENTSNCIISKSKEDKYDYVSFKEAFKDVNTFVNRYSGSLHSWILDFVYNGVLYSASYDRGKTFLLIYSNNIGVSDNLSALMVNVNSYIRSYLAKGKNDLCNTLYYFVNIRNKLPSNEPVSLGMCYDIATSENVILNYVKVVTKDYLSKDNITNTRIYEPYYFKYVVDRSVFFDLIPDELVSWEVSFNCAGASVIIEGNNGSKIAVKTAKGVLVDIDNILTNFKNHYLCDINIIGIDELVYKKDL